MGDNAGRRIVCTIYNLRRPVGKGECKERLQGMRIVGFDERQDMVGGRICSTGEHIRDVGRHI